MLPAPPLRSAPTGLLSPAPSRRDADVPPRDTQRAPAPRAPANYLRSREAPPPPLIPQPRAFPWDDPALVIAGPQRARDAAHDVAKPPRRLIAATIAVSLAVHVGAIAAAMPSNEIEQFGALAEDTRTISLATTETVVLESIMTDKAQAAAAAASEAGSLQSALSVPQQLSEVTDLPTPDEPPPKPVEVAEVTPAAVAPTEDPLPVIRGGADPDDVSEVKAVERAETPVEAMPDTVETKEDEAEKIEREKEEKKEKKQTEQKQSPQQTAGSTTSRSSVAQAASNGQVSASRGNALSYGAGVRAQVARNKPSGSGQRGTAAVSFGIDATGGLSYVRVSQSSGNASLDEAALTAVRRAAPFGEPPPGSSLPVLFAIEFNFR